MGQPVGIDAIGLPMADEKVFVPAIIKNNTSEPMMVWSYEYLNPILVQILPGDSARVVIEKKGTVANG